MMDPKAVVISGSGKGGTGKTTLSVNLAIELSKRTRTGLLDCDVRAPNVTRMLGLRNQEMMYDANRKLIPLFYSPNLEVFSTASLFPEGLGIAWQGENVRAFIEQSITDVAWGPVDVLVADLEPSAGDTIYILEAMFRKRIKAMLVSTPRYVSLDDARRMLDICRDKDIEVLGIIANMTSSQCPICNEVVHHCGQPFEPFGTSNNVQDLASMERIPYLGEIRFNPYISRKADMGDPVLPATSNGIVMHIVDDLMKRLS